MKRLEPHAPIYAFTQPDGSSVTVDLTEPGPYSDFAMTLRFADGRERWVAVYHSYERHLFLAILNAWAHAAPPETIATGLEQVRAELSAMAEQRLPSDTSEHDFSRDLPEIASIAAGSRPLEPAEYPDETRTNQLQLIADPVGLTFRSVGKRAAPVSFRISAADFPALIAGMIWRTLGDLWLSRLNTDTYLQALETFEQGVRAREGD